jgi:hypothetical protein
MKTALMHDQIIAQGFEYQPVLGGDFERHQ